MSDQKTTPATVTPTEDEALAAKTAAEQAAQKASDAQAAPGDPAPPAQDEKVALVAAETAATAAADAAAKAAKPSTGRKAKKPADRIEEYVAVAPGGKQLRMRRNIETGATEILGEVEDN